MRSTLEGYFFLLAFFAFFAFAFFAFLAMLPSSPKVGSMQVEHRRACLSKYTTIKKLILRASNKVNDDHSAALRARGISFDDGDELHELCIRLPGSPLYEARRNGV